MEHKHAKLVLFTIGLILTVALIVYAHAVFLLAFASILLGILLNAIGKGAKRVTHLPYFLALVVALVVIFGVIALIFWLYSEKISDQFELLIKQLPQAYASVHNYLAGHFGIFWPEQKLQQEFSLNRQNISQLFSFFSTTIGSIASFVVFIFVGFYLAFDPQRYAKWIFTLVPTKKQSQVRTGMEKIGKSLQWWLLGKLFSMIVVGIATVIGLSLLNVSLALILGFLAGLLTFIPYVGALLASVPAILIAFAQSPIKAIWVALLYLGIHTADGYFITPFIEQRTVSVPPALSIMAQILLVFLVGFMGLALATPLVVVAVALAHRALHKNHSSA